MTDRTVEHGTIEVERTYPVAPARVFRAWADPGARSRWDVPGEGWDHAVDERSFRVGGRDVIRFGPAGHLAYRGDTRYEDIVDDHRIVFTYTVAEHDRLMSVSVMTVELYPDGEGTRMLVTEQGVFVDGRDSTAIRRGGIDEMLDKLAEQLRD